MAIVGGIFFPYRRRRRRERTRDDRPCVLSNEANSFTFERLPEMKSDLVAFLLGETHDCNAKKHGGYWKKWISIDRERNGHIIWRFMLEDYIFTLLKNKLLVSNC